jgi:hypothetical protein
VWQEFEAAVAAAGQKSPPGLRRDGAIGAPGRNILRKSGPNMIAADNVAKEGQRWHRRRETDNKGPAKCAQS